MTLLGLFCSGPRPPPGGVTNGIPDPASRTGGNGQEGGVPQEAPRALLLVGSGFRRISRNRRCLWHRSPRQFDNQTQISVGTWGRASGKHICADLWRPVRGAHTSCSTEVVHTGGRKVGFRSPGAGLQNGKLRPRSGHEGACLWGKALSSLHLFPSLVSGLVRFPPQVISRLLWGVGPCRQGSL